ncbi:hypothetical protein BUALT_Bualt05G0084600 [Buddleja alternifolia]|uniref:Phosphatidylinositol-glycan biosynthesis class X protein n=1 Tax=Buddleja alternifolia TaxID=168488 RepID=A0AAV6XTR4_9LAMI|nr:hypothetical protein BUALT_Bualt05G0084600 [Buddleja alternifolia]
MEIQQFKQVQTNSMIRFLLIFLVIIHYSAHASSSYEQTDFVEKYIAKTYFEKYDSFVDSQFSFFIENEIPLGMSEMPRDNSNVMSILHRNIIGEGSHRRLSSSMRLKTQSELTEQSCEIIIIERLPNGVFADPFELQHLVHRGVFNDVAVFGDTNLELPSFRSNQSVVEIHMIYEDDSEINLDVPLHARYPPLGHGFSLVEFGQPDLFLCCCGLGGNSVNRSCLLMQTSEDKASSPVIWEIPCGIKEHAQVVSAVSFGFAVVAALLIVLASISYSDSTGFDKSKHS